MKNLQRIGMIVAMTAIAGGSGYYMQSKHGNGALSQGPVPESITPIIARSTAPQTTPVAEQAPVIGGDHTALAIASGVPVRVEPEQPVQLAAVEMQETTRDNVQTDVATPNCEANLVLIAQPGAMLDVGLLAPCHQDQRVVIRHAGLVVTGQTSSAGSLVATIPALASPAEVRVSLIGGAELSESAPVPDLGRFDRIGVQWMANDAFQIHAYENGASFGEQGHLSATNPGRASELGGFVTLIGDDRAERPLLAEIYTFPAGQSVEDLGVNLTIEAAVTERSCGREILGETIELNKGKLTFRDLTIAMPDCDAIGDFMVLEHPLMLAEM
jgi:hypothetical protein